ncbi:cation diffusion facilitator transporter family protein [Paraburkholderia xenovorans LB400]|uniref:cation diffusion facilitator family transporter n=1 Tax=Paraburkholderia xenovorans TaxID=36873 RepID=UPI0002E5390D|nr:cation diffusion facilitator family transporter [Paraburkholderia xenovorans]AIP35358.1 cation diffusion facilitator transporter family protein [Paraburkholderia xenovorans LB400]
MFKAASASALLNAFLSAMQIAIGLMADSDGLFADGVHTLSDLAADSVVLIVLYLTTRHRRAKPRMAGNSGDRGIEQALAALFIAAVLTITAVDMLWTSIAQTSTLSGGTALHIGALAISGFVMLAKEALFRYLRAEGARTGSAILLASAWHARVDAVSALVATLGLAGSLAGMPMLDHIAGAAIGLMIMRMGYTSGRSALKQLFAGAPGNTPAGQAAE